MPMRVLIAEDHAIVREGVRLILESQPDMVVVGEATNGHEAVELARALHPDVVCMDISMPDMDGIEAARRIKQQRPEVAIVALTVHDNEEYFFQMLRAGASGYVLKGAAAADLVAALRSAAGGAVFLYPTLAKKLVDDYVSRWSARRADEPHHGLTPREREILALIAQGLSNRDVAVRLVISTSTVQTHVAHLIEKLGLNHRAALIQYAIRHGFLDGDD
ncbi:MAG: DNA-binding response regulator [Chloroflexi bacterium CFX6]|nr:DNA-binding response regulator [Chloroflexi bacterium CFX6]